MFDNNFIFIQDNGQAMHLSTPTHKFKEVITAYNKTVSETEQLPLIRFHDLRHPYVKHTTKNKFLLLCTTSYSNLIDARRKIPVMIWYFPVAMLPTFFLTSLHLYEVCNNIVEHRVVKVFPREYTITYFC